MSLNVDNPCPLISIWSPLKHCLFHKNQQEIHKKKNLVNKSFGLKNKKVDQEEETNQTVVKQSFQILLENLRADGLASSAQQYGLQSLFLSC